MEADAAFFLRAMERLPRWMLGIAIAGALIAAMLLGVPWGAGFLLGAVASYLNYQLLKKVVDVMTGAQPKRRFAITFFFYVFRLALAAAAGFAILRYSELSLSAALTGLFVPLAAVIAEILFELVFSR